MRTRQKSGIGRYTPFLLHPSNLIRDIPPPPNQSPWRYTSSSSSLSPLTPHRPSREHHCCWSYHVKKIPGPQKKKRDHYMQPQRRRTPTNSNALLPQPCAKYRNSTVHGRRAGGMWWWWEHRARPSSLGVASICVLGVANREYRICRRRDSSTRMRLCCRQRVDLSQASK